MFRTRRTRHVGRWFDGLQYDYTTIDDMIVCDACEFERRQPGVKVKRDIHTCFKPLIGSEPTVFGERMSGLTEEITRTLTSDYPSPHIARYALDELWPHKRFVKPINQLATPHLRNIVNLFAGDKGKAKFDAVTAEDGLEASNMLWRRVNNVRRELTRRDNDLTNRIHNFRIRCEGVAEKIGSAFYPAPDDYEVKRVLKDVAVLLADVQTALSKTDE